LNARAVADMEAPMIALTDTLLDRMADKGEADLIADLAAAVPIEVIGNLLAIPHEKRAPLRDWSLAILGALEPAPGPELLAAGETAVAEFLDYLRILVADRRKRPGDPARDVLTRLIQGEQDGEQLTEVELLQNVIFILNAGHETTTNLIGNGLYALLEWPAEKQRLIADPGLINSAVEEFLRFESPVQIGNRLVTREAEVGGVAMPAGAFITIGIAAANRDPSEFQEPDRLDVGRARNRHVAFASGVHFCVGLNIARMEGALPSAVSWRGFRTIAWPVRQSAAGARAFAASCRSRWPWRRLGRDRAGWGMPGFVVASSSSSSSAQAMGNSTSGIPAEHLALDARVRGAGGGQGGEKHEGHAEPGHACPPGSGVDLIRQARDVVGQAAGGVAGLADGDMRAGRGMMFNWLSASTSRPSSRWTWAMALRGPARVMPVTVPECETTLSVWSVRRSCLDSM
jgi:cytochrome P450